jgi:cell division protein FtsI (penicillin-binding protein 3)
MKPSFIEKVIDEDQKETTFPPVVIESSICSQETVAQLKSLLEGVVVRGTAKRPFKGSLYKVAGKTGTAKFNYAKNGKSKVEYRSSFAGYFPADNPRFSCIVVITNPRANGIYGGKTAAPVFRKISDRVYALDKELRTELIAETSSDNMKIKNGIEVEVVAVMNELKIKSNVIGSSDYVKASVKGNELKTSNYKIVNNKVANVKGMTVRDALFILEQQGLTVKIIGRGKVIKQSLSPGSKIIKGKQIEITLG